MGIIIINVKYYAKSCSFICTVTIIVIILHRVFHGIDLRLIRLVVGRQSIFFFFIPTPSKFFSNIKKTRRHFSQRV